MTSFPTVNVSNKIPKDIQAIIWEFVGVDEPKYLDKKFQFKKNASFILINYQLRMYIPRQAAGFGSSVDFCYVLPPGLHKKDRLTSTLLRRGFFGEYSAELECRGWEQLRGAILMTVELNRPGY